MVTMEPNQKINNSLDRATAQCWDLQTEANCNIQNSNSYNIGVFDIFNKILSFPYSDAHFERVSRVNEFISTSLRLAHIKRCH